MNNLENISKEIRRNILKMHFFSQESHIGSALSCADILAVLYFKILNIDPKNPKLETRDRFILSKGHAVAALYATLVSRGFFPEDILDTFCSNGRGLPGHATRNNKLGIDASTGSLGHGLPISCGMALAAKRDKKKYRVFVLMSDGEMDEGTTWEAALFASHNKLDNLVTIVDYNKFQAYGKTNEVLNLEPFKRKWEAFGWKVKEINGHNFNEIEKVLSSIPLGKNKPSVINSHTVKGKGVSFMENKLEWHYKSPTKQEYDSAIKEINKK
jgi:transketolase